MRFSKLEFGVLGEFQPSSFSVDIDPSQIRSVRNSLGPDSKNMYATEQAEDVLGTLMHEVQHAVQDMDPVFKAKRSAAPQTPEQLDNWLLDLTGGANLETFSKLEKRLPDYVLKNKNAEWLKKVTEDPLFDKFNNYRTSSGEVGANITMRDLPLTLMERLSRSNPKEMLKSAGVSDRFKKGVSIDARDTPIGQLVSQIERAQKEEISSSF